MYCIECDNVYDLPDTKIIDAYYHNNQIEGTVITECPHCHNKEESSILFDYISDFWIFDK